MGIKNLHTFLRKQCPTIYKEISLTDLAFKKIAIDLSIYLCKYKCLYKEKWLDAFLNLMNCLRKNEIHFVFILDSKSPPEKEEEKQNRILQREKLKSRINDLEQGMQEYLETNQLNHSIQQLLIKKPFQKSEPTPTLSSHLLSEIEKMKSNVLNIQSEDFDIIKELFDIMNVPYFYAISEAEASCAHLCLNGMVDAVLTEDTDILTYGCPKFLHRINIQENTIILIEMKHLLNELNFNYSQFLDFCIMCGTDYNSNIPKIGPERAFRLITEYKNIDNLNIPFDLSILKHQRVRELFHNDIVFDIPDIYCGVPDLHKLQYFGFTHNCHFNLLELYHSFSISSAEMMMIT